ncbi:MAG: hypothetical protein E6Q99_04275 [Elusimicrobia bacterium]|nr:MAG: hypothetical protein E6Q99_04275 [Elusimicrobiota bacterium]
MNLRSMGYGLRTLILISWLCLLNTVHAQVLFVDDNDNILENSTTMRAALDAAGVTYSVYDVAVEGSTPSLSTMLTHELVVWYCSGDGVGLGLWNAVEDLQDVAMAGVPIWFIGTDMLYASYGAAPTTFTTADLPYTVMGLASYDVQSYGDDGGEGCPQIDAGPAVTANFTSGLTWIFPTLWWMDGVTPAPGNVEVLYQMGPAGYALGGLPCMVRKLDEGMDVTSTFFDPSLLATAEMRSQFVAETVAHLGLSTAVVNFPEAAPVRVSALGDDRWQITATHQLHSVVLLGADGRVVKQERANAAAWMLDLHGFSTGSYVVVATTIDGRSAALRLSKL